MAGNGMDFHDRVGLVCPWCLEPGYHADNSPDRYLHYLEYNMGIEKAFREVLSSVGISLRSYRCKG